MRPPAPRTTNRVEPHRSPHDALPWGLWSALGGGVASILAVIGLRRWLRHRPRTCARCRQPMLRLDEVADDDHLDHGERTEESVASVDYDIWCCSACPHVLKLRYGAWWTSYARCPQCHAVTRSSSRTTLVAATYDRGGKVQIDEACAACSYRNRFIRHTPRRTRPSTHGRGSFGPPGGGGGSFGSRSGGGSSSGSSAGGGRSSGRGGGGGW